MARLVITYDPAERFIVGTVGEPGERSFFIQAREGKRLTSVLIEKAQVVAIVERLDLLLRELKRIDPNLEIGTSSRDDEPLEQPIVEEFRVGLITLSWMSDRELVSIELHATSEGDEVEEAPFSEDPENAPDMLHVLLTADQTQSFVKRAMTVVGAGRPPCPFCGLPLDPRGHVCPRANGYRR
ncbi:MAG: DUF3090 family protein [Actinobacteria bacterium]|nr:DUF3090 family protein [Actinomycetota bacterium]